MDNYYGLISEKEGIIGIGKNISECRINAAKKGYIDHPNRLIRNIESKYTGLNKYSCIMFENKFKALSMLKSGNYNPFFYVDMDLNLII
jgi:hypothetical protein